MPPTKMVSGGFFSVKLVTGLLAPNSASDSNYRYTQWYKNIHTYMHKHTHTHTHTMYHTSDRVLLVIKYFNEWIMKKKFYYNNISSGKL